MGKWKSANLEPVGMTCLFVDTNVLLHYRRLEELDWLSLSKAEEVLVVLCPVVIRELDRHKIAHPQGKFRKRAQDIVADLHSRLSGSNSNVIRDCVRLEFLSEDPSLDFGAHKLRSELADDWLIASAIEWKEKHQNDETRIVSADLGISIKARAHGISALAPLETDKLSDELDAEEKRIKELQKELAEIKNSLPCLRLCFWDQPQDQNFVRFQIPPRFDFDMCKAEEALQQIREQHPQRPIPDAAQERALMKELEKHFWKGNMNVLFPVSGAELQSYNQKLEAFYQAYAAYLRQLHNHHNSTRRMISIELGLQNTGTSPAEDIDVHAHFPDGFQLFDGDAALPPPPEPPKPPRQPGTVGGLDLGGLHGIGRILTAPAPTGLPPNVSSPFIRRTNSYEARSQVKKAKHGYTLRLAKFIAVFESDDALRSFKIEYSISAANLPSAVNDHLSVIIEKGT